MVWRCMKFNGPYFFGIATQFEEVMAELGDKPLVRIIRMRRVPFIDSTGVNNLSSLCRMSHKEGIRIVLSGVNETYMPLFTIPDLQFTE